MGRPCQTFTETRPILEPSPETESNSGEIQESGINPEKTSSNSISSFGSRSKQISASRKPLFLDTTLCLKEPLEETMVTQGQESCLHTPVWGVEGFNISTSKEVEEELTTGKQHTRVFNGPDHVDENTNDTAMINTINFDDILLGGEVDHSTSTAPMDMIEEEVENENLMIENNTVPLLEDTTNIMEMIENASFDFTLPEPIPSTTLHGEEQKLEVEQMVEVIDNNTETVWAGLSFDDANLGLCLPAIEAEGRIELPVDVANNNNNNNVESSESDDLLKWIMDDTQIADFAFPDEVEQATTSFLIEEVKTEEVEEAEEPPKVKRSRIKLEELTEEEKYRRMREQNNRASQTCRAKRKRKLAEEEEELTILQQKNIQLQTLLKNMEKEVASYKKRILEQVTAGVRN